MLALILLAACAQGPPRPVEIEPGDACALCRMAISQKMYAAELVDGEQRVFKFDDIGCLLRFAREHGLIKSTPAGTYIFVSSYDRHEWQRIESARFVQSSEIPTPMGSGLIAVADRSQAEAYAASFHGRALSFTDIWK